MFLKNLKIGQKMFLGFGTITLLMLAILVYSFIGFSRGSSTVELNLHSYEIMQEADGIAISLANMESGARGFAITGKDEFLEPYTQGKKEYAEHYGRMRELTDGNTRQQDRLATLQTNYEAWLQWEETQLVEERRKVTKGQAKMEDLIALIQQGKGKDDMDNLKKLIDQIVEEEHKVLKARSEELVKISKWEKIILPVSGLFAAALSMIISLLIIRIVVLPVITVTKTFKQIAEDDVDLEVRLRADSNDELGEMGKFFNKFMDRLKILLIENKNQTWLKTGQAELNERIQGEQELTTLCSNIISYVAKYVDAQVGALYIRTNENTYRLYSSYAYNRRKNLSNEIKVGEGIVGQVALEKQTIVITGVPEDYIKITSGVGEATPRNILVAPCSYNNDINCIIEFGSFHQFTDVELQFVEEISSSIAVAVQSTNNRSRMQELLDKSMRQAEELQNQQEELRASNEELEEQTRALKESEGLLQSQQEELRITNEELAERTKNLQQQKNDMETKNEILKNAQLEIEEKAKALEIASKYKSEFMANMSHELRTPLNSILVLSQMLAERNDGSTITEKQLEYAKTINTSGKDLLRLINDILDLAKIEAGKMEVNFEKLYLADLAAYVERSFKPVAEQKGLEFNIEIRNDIPEAVVSDTQRVQQIVNNLLSNAFKFTDKGEVTMSISALKDADIKDFKNNDKGFIAISVTDTGIGIPADKQSIIFEAFKQSDGTTSRKYGGTGLGLSISKDLAALLGGGIYLSSREGFGSTFTLALPLDGMGIKEAIDINQLLNNIESKPIFNNISLSDQGIKDLQSNEPPLDDKKVFRDDEKLLLIIEDDKNFSKVLIDLAQEKGYTCLAANNGSSGMQLAKQFRPDAILLDIGLPDISGWKVIEELKKDTDTAKIPVHVITGIEIQGLSEKRDNIIGYLKKPVTLEEIDGVFKKLIGNLAKPFKKLLIADEDQKEVDRIRTILKEKGIQVSCTGNGKEAYRLLMSDTFDCMILDLHLKELSGLQLLKKLAETSVRNLPVIIHTEKELTQEDEAELKKYAESIIIKGTRSIDRLSAEASLFLHDVASKLENKKIQLIKSSHEKENSLKDKQILIVDDDMRNVFALTNVLEEKGLKVIVGRNGKEGIQKLQQNSGIDLVLMDIMMPEMDGYTAMIEIRKMDKYHSLPIIAITAKAMKEDRDRCIEAGASDYLTKPIDIDKLISLLRVWLYS